MNCPLQWIQIKAEMLNDFFKTVFTIEKTKRIDTPVLNPLCDAKLVDTDVSVDL